MCFVLSSAHAGQYARDTPRSPMNSPTMKMFLNSASWRWRIVGSCGLPRIYRTRIGNSHAEGCSAIRSAHRKTVGNFQVETQLWSGGSPKNQAPLVSNYCRSPERMVLHVLINRMPQRPCEAKSGSNSSRNSPFFCENQGTNRETTIGLTLTSR